MHEKLFVSFIRVNKNDALLPLYADSKHIFTNKYQKSIISNIEVKLWMRRPPTFDFILVLLIFIFL